MIRRTLIVPARPVIFAFVASVFLLLGASGCGGSSSGSRDGGGNAGNAAAGKSVDGSAGMDGALAGDGGLAGEKSDGASVQDTATGDGARDVGNDVNGDTSGDGSNLDAMCGCFIHGTWAISNSSPCFLSASSGDSVSGAVSTIVEGQQFACPSDPTVLPGSPWSMDSLTADCAGHYRLCYTIKAGNSMNPQATDCVVAQACAEADYSTVNQAQAWPSLPAWIATGTQVTCAQALAQTGGYGEETVTGTPTGCTPIAKTLSRVTYCPLTCNGPNPPATCNGCMPGGSGMF
jgi:hypothetical protein